MRAIRIAIVAAAVVLFTAVAPVHAQPFAQALGHPLQAKDTPPGTVVVRLIAGSIGKGVIGADVTLVVNNTPRVARTDAGGRATFADLPIGATAQVKITDEDKKELSSDSFPIDADMGTRLMMSTRPMGGAAPDAGGDMGGDPSAAGAQGGPMIEPRKASGQPRLDPAYAKGTIQVLVVYDDFTVPQAGVPVALVGYHSDNSVSVAVKATDDKGRAEFGGLDLSGNIAYFPLTSLPRNNALDRLIGRPIMLEGTGGVHVILSGAKRDSTEPPIDDYSTKVGENAQIPAGKVKVMFQSATQQPARIRIVDAVTGKPVSEGDVVQIPADPKAVRFQTQFADDRKDVDPGLLGVIVHGGAIGTPDQRLEGAKVHLVDTGAAPDAPADPALAELLSSKDGEAVFHLPSATDTPRKYKVVVTYKDVTHTTDEVTVTGKTGALMEVVVLWDTRGHTEAVLDVPHIAGRVLYAQAVGAQYPYNSAPFQTIPTAGTQTSVLNVPRNLLTFHLGGTVDDVALGVQGTFTLTNYSWAPFAASPDGTFVPLPKGFKGVVVGEGDQEMVAADPGEGFRVVRPVPPNGMQFHGGFSLPVDGDTIHWTMDLPYGAFDSSLKILKTADMKIDAPMRVSSEDMEGFGPIYALENIRIRPAQAMVMRVTGLPHQPLWKLWVPRILGGLVIVIILGGVAFALTRAKPAPTAAHDASTRRAARREALLELLVELEREAHANGGSLDDQQKRRRDTMITELEALWGDD